MAAATGSSPTNHSPRFSSADSMHSPRSRVSPRVVSSPWTQVARVDSDSPPSVPSLPASIPFAPSSAEQNLYLYECVQGDDLCASPSAEERIAEDISGGSDKGNDSNNSLATRKPAWTMPSSGNGAVKIGQVMGADSWPALSESAKPSSKSSSDSAKSSHDGSTFSLQVAGNVTSSMQSPSSSPQKQTSTTGNRHFTMNNALPARQRFFKRGNVNLVTNNANGSVPTASAPADAPPLSASPREHTNKGAKWDTSQRGSGSQNNSEHHQQRYRRNNTGPNPRNENSYHTNSGVRNEYDWGNQEWHSQRNIGGRNVHLHPRTVPGAFVRPSPNTPPFMAPPPFRPFAGPLGFEMAAPMVYIHHDSFTGVPFIAPVPRHAVMFPSVDPQLQNKVVNQIEYYFSNENLIKDTYLRQQMDEHGWVSINLIAGFNKVKCLTYDLHFILDALHTSSTAVQVEVRTLSPVSPVAVVPVGDDQQGERVRRRHDWMRWIMPPPLASSFQDLSLTGGSATSAPSTPPLLPSNAAPDYHQYHHHFH